MAGPESTPIPSEQQKVELVEQLSALVQAGKWADITPGMFSVLPRAQVEFARDVAFDNRITYIGTQISQLGNLIEFFTDNSDIQNLANGRISELKDELARVLQTRYPETKPVALTKTEQASMLLNRDANAAIQFFVSMGEIDALNPDTLPALKHLKKETLMELQIDALLAKMSRYKTWKETEIDGEKYGFYTAGAGGKSHLDILADSQIEGTVKQIESLSVELADLKASQNNS